MLKLLPTARLILATAILSLNVTAVSAADAPPMVDPDLVVMSHWSVKLPFTLDENDPTRIGEVQDAMWVWMKPGARILSVNGIELGNLNATRAILRMSTELTDQTQLLVKFGVGRDADGDMIEEFAALPVIQDTVLKNGLHFETKFAGTAWETTLVGRPDTAQTDLQLGDKLLSFKDKAFDGRLSAKEVFQYERRMGMMSYEVVYLRDGEVRTGSISLDDGKVDAPKLVSAPARDRANLVVLSQWNVRLPMKADANVPTKLAESDYFNAGDTIVSVNGVEVGNINAVAPVLRLATEIKDQTNLDVRFGVKKPGTLGISTEKMSLPIVQTTVLGNGMRFETQYAKYSWETKLVHVPEDAETDLVVGDRILAYSDGQPINGRTSMRDAIETDRRKGMDKYEVIVLRKGGFMNCKIVF